MNVGIFLVELTEITRWFTNVLQKLIVYLHSTNNFYSIKWFCCSTEPRKNLFFFHTLRIDKFQFDRSMFLKMIFQGDQIRFKYISKYVELINDECFAKRS